MTDQMKQKIDDTLNRYSAHAEISTNNRGRVWKLDREEATLEITLGPGWLGYNLELKGKAFGKSLGLSEDTDSYPLGGDYSDTTLALLDEILACLEAFLKAEIYTSKQGGKFVLIVPKNKNEYNVIKQGRFLGSRSSVTKSSLKIDEYRPIS